ncbi:hypothetical protein BH11PSE5_BH11PSE5_22810 [soil metagenome]
MVLLGIIIRMNAAIEDVYPSVAIPFFGLHLAAWAAAAWLLMRYTTTGGMGMIESHLIRLISRGSVTWTLLPLKLELSSRKACGEACNTL